MLLMTTGVFCHLRPDVLVSNSHAFVRRTTFCGVICASVEKRACPASFPYVFHSFWASAAAASATTPAIAGRTGVRRIDHVILPAHMYACPYKLGRGWYPAGRTSA